MQEIATLLINYFAAKQQVHEAFGYKADWREIPLDDMTDVFWWLDTNMVYWCDEKPDHETVERNAGEYDAEIYTQRFLPRWVYPAETHTLVSIDTHVDGNKFLAVFHNDRYVGLVPLADLVAQMPTNPIFGKK